MIGFMPARVLPPKEELEKMLERGMTHREIAEAVTRATGVQVRRSSVSAAVHRAGLSGSNKRYPDEIPWRVKEEHLTHYAARMLRLLGRRNAKIQNSSEQDARLDAWLEKLEAEEAVVTYHPDTEQGFWYVPGKPDEKGVPVLKELPF